LTVITTRLLMVVLPMIASACGGGNNSSQVPPPPPPSATLTTEAATCTGGAAGDFTCGGVDLRARVPLAIMEGTGGSDVWGWFDAQTGDEYALVGMTDATAFVNVTNAEVPVFLGTLPTAAGTSVWRDIKVYQDYAYIVADNTGAHGMQLFDLTRLRGQSAPQTFSADLVYGDFGSAHNLAINEDSGFAFAVGTDTCSFGLHMIDITTPGNPMFAGCYATASSHDAHCVAYQGPDVDYAGSEICANAAEDHFEIVDVTLKSAPVTVSTDTYAQLGYVHQAWFTEDHRFVLLGDELDELDFLSPTRTHVYDVADLDNPVYVFAYEATTSAIDHNLYVLGNQVYSANYTVGLRILEHGDLANSELTEVAFFDTFPANDTAEFAGAWSVYPFLPSGNLLVSDASNGLFILTAQ